MKRLRWMALVAILTLVAAACGGDDGPDDAATTDGSSTTAAPETPTSTTTTAAVTTAAPTTTTVAAPTTTGAPPLAAPNEPVAESDLPGEDLDFGYSEGTILSVFGVRYDDVLNVRTIPGLGGEIIATLDPLETGFVATGRHRLLPTTVWSELLVGGVTHGWVNRSFLGMAGVYSAEVVSFDGSSDDATGETLEALGQAVADAFVDTPEVVQRIEFPLVPSETAVWVDLVGIGDDASNGYRLIITPVEGFDGWAVGTIDLIDMCSRGGSPGGLCP